MVALVKQKESRLHGLVSYHYHCGSCLWFWKHPNVVFHYHRQGSAWAVPFYESPVGT